MECTEVDMKVGMVYILYPKILNYPKKKDSSAINIPMNFPLIDNRLLATKLRSPFHLLFQRCMTVVVCCAAAAEPTLNDGSDGHKG